MKYLILVIGFLLTFTGCTLATLDNPPSWSVLTAVVGIGFIVLGAIMANRAGKSKV